MFIEVRHHQKGNKDALKTFEIKAEKQIKLLKNRTNIAQLGGTLRA